MGFEKFKSKDDGREWKGFSYTKDVGNRTKKELFAFKGRNIPNVNKLL